MKYASPRGRLPDGSPNPIDIHVGHRIRLRRFVLGMSQQKLADALGVSFQQIQKLEGGKNRTGASRLWDLAEVLKCQVQYFFDGMATDVARQSPRHLASGRSGPYTPDTSDELSVKHFRAMAGYIALSAREQEAVDGLIKSLGHRRPHPQAAAE